MRKILVTGATGFLGAYVIKNLLGKGHLIIGTSGSTEKAEKCEWIQDIKYLPLDLTAVKPTDNYYDFFDRPDTVIHLAWHGLPNYYGLFHVEENLPLQKTFLKNLIENGLQDLTVTGTCFEYGMKEGCLSEWQEVRPHNAYAIAKNELRKFLEQLQSAHPFKLKWLRLFYMYGEGQGAGSLFTQLEKALNNNEEVFNMSGGEQVRDFLPAETMADYIVQIALQRKVTGIINCCSGNPVTVKNLVEQYLKDKGGRIKLNLGFYPYPEYEPMRFWGDNSKLKTIIGND